MYLSTYSAILCSLVKFCSFFQWGCLVFLFVCFLLLGLFFADLQFLHSFFVNRFLITFWLMIAVISVGICYVPYTALSILHNFYDKLMHRSFYYVCFTDGKTGIKEVK